MKTQIKILFLFFTLMGCDKDSGIYAFTEKNNTPIFKIDTASGYPPSYLKIAISDLTNSKENDIVLFETNLMTSHPLIIQKNLKDYSKTGIGYFKIFAKIGNSQDTLYRAFGSYNAYNFIDDSLPNHNAFQITLTENQIGIKTLLINE